MNFFGIFNRFSLKYLAAAFVVVLFTEMVFGFAPHTAIQRPAETDVAVAESEKTAKITEKVQKIIESGECYSLKMLNVSGDELASIGFKGKEIGEELNVLLNACMETPSLNENERLKELAEKHFARFNKRSRERLS